MQNNKFCYRYDSYNKITTEIPLQQDHMNGGFMFKPDDSLYENPESIELEEHETLVISGGVWTKTPWYVGTKLYHKTDKLTLEITAVGKLPSDYSDYTDVEIPDIKYANYYDFSESTNSWLFNLDRYISDASKHISDLCVSANYKMFPQYKRDNVYSGSPVTDGYPDYLKGDAGKRSIAKLNAVYQQIAVNAQLAIKSINITTKDEVNTIVDALVFPTEAEILAQIQG